VVLPVDGVPEGGQTFPTIGVIHEGIPRAGLPAVLRPDHTPVWFPP
jgi:hypothetical protein